MTTKGTSVNALSANESFQLMKLIEAEYTKGGLNYPAFAQYATEILGFEVNSDHVRNRCSQMGIPANSRAGSSHSKDHSAELAALVTRVQYLESQNETLRLWFKENFNLKGPKL